MARRFSLPLPFRRRSTTAASCRSALSQNVSLEAAVAELVAALQVKRGAPGADLALVFCSTAYASDLQRLMPLLRQAIPAQHWIGCAGGGVVGTDATGQPHELEHKPGISVTVLQLPGAAL